MSQWPTIDNLRGPTFINLQDSSKGSALQENGRILTKVHASLVVETLRGRLKIALRVVGGEHDILHHTVRQQGPLLRGRAANEGLVG